MSDSFVTPWTVAHQVPVSMEFPRQEYWNGSPFPLPGDLLDPGIKLSSSATPALAVDSLPLYHLGSVQVSISTKFPSAGNTLGHGSTF